MQIKVNRKDKLSRDTTVNLDNSMTATAIQALIDSMPKNLGGFTLTFQFADGTYTLTTELNFSDFYSGTLDILGNAANNTASTTKSVYLDFTGDTNGIFMSRNSVYINVFYLKVGLHDDVVTISRTCIYSQSCSGEIEIQYCYVTTNGVVRVRGMLLYACATVNLRENYYTGGWTAIYSVYTSSVLSKNGYSSGLTSGHGLSALVGGILAKHDSNQPSGTVPEFTGNGGVIR